MPDFDQYDEFKQYHGQTYSGMKVGATHKWYYDQGEWRERKQAPDEWKIYYTTVKRRAGHAPDESGAPVGTEYNWLIVAHQRVDKLDANSYMTYLEGMKFKVAHKRAGKEKWNVSEKTQRKRTIAFLQQVIRQLQGMDEEEETPFSVGEHNRIYGLELKTREELYEIASEYDIPGRSGMKRQALLEAVKAVKDKEAAAPQKKNGKKDTKERVMERSSTALSKAEANKQKMSKTKIKEA